MSGQPLRSKRVGETITADEWNLLIDEVNALRGLKVSGGSGSGGVVSRMGRALSIVLDPPRALDRIPCIITVAPTYAPMYPGDAVYSGHAVGQPDLSFTDARPVVHRIVRDDDGPTGKGWCGIWPAKVGTTAFLHRTFDSEGALVLLLEVVDERIYTGPCDEGEALNTPTPPNQTQDEPNIQSPGDEGGAGGGGIGTGGVGGVGETTAP